MQEESCDTFVAFKGDNTSLQRKGEGLGYPYQDQADQPLISTYVIDPKVPKPSAQLYGGDNNMASTSQSRCMELSSPPNSSDSSSTASPDGRKGKKEKKLKKWQIFPGRNKFLCGGRIIMAVSTGILNFTVCLIVFTVALFFAFECRLTLVTDIPYGFFIPIACAFIFIFNMSCLLRTAWSDPGIIPRALPDEAGFIEKISTENQRSDSLTPGYRPPPRVLEVIVNGVPMKLKYCFTCKIFRPPRASHCSLCDNCVENFDHHCPWVGNCVGKRNYKYFFLFVSSLTVLCIYIFTFCIVHIVLLTKRQGGFLNALKMSPGSVFEVLICFFSVWSVTGLTGFHSYLIALSLTTNEDIKGTWSKKRNQNVNNPFDRGSILKNCSYALCSPMPPSSIRRRDFATKEELEVHKKGVEQRLSGRSLTAQPRTSNGYPIADHEPYDSSQALYPRQYPPVPSLQPIPPAPSQGITQQNVAIAPSAAAAVAVSPSSVIENRQNDGSPSRYQLNSSPEVTKNTNGITMTSPHPHNGAHHHHHHHHGVGGYNFNNNGGQRNSGIESSSSTLSSSGSHSQPSSVVVVEHIGSPAPSPPPHPPTTAPSRGDPNNASLNDSRAKLLRVDEKGESKSCKSVELKLG